MRKRDHRIEEKSDKRQGFEHVDHDDEKGDEEGSLGDQIGDGKEAKRQLEQQQREADSNGGWFKTSNTGIPDFFDRVSLLYRYPN